MADGTALRRVAEQVAGLTDLLPTGADPVASAEALRYALRFVAAGITVCVAHDDTDAPAFGTMSRDRLSWGLDNPDCLYRYTRVDPTATYRIRGRLGTPTHAELQVNSGHFGDGDFSGWQAVSAVTAAELVTGDDGAVEIWLASQRPVGADGRPVDNWLALDDRASFLLFRQYFGDWEAEEPADLSIDRIATDGADPRRGHPALPPGPHDPDEAARQTELLLQWLDAGARCWQALSDGIRGGAPGDVTPFVPPASASGLKGQAYGFGTWRCGPDEAVVVELAPPPCRLWSVALADPSWQSIDFADRQSSLNARQVGPLPDGRFVGVIAHDDPGVRTWLDPGGHTSGTIAVRYLFDPAQLPDADATLPPLRQRVVPRAALADALPDDLPRVTPAARADALARRRAAVVRRGGV
ncbi:MAG: hypothetical protein R2726_19565 [Acidimicrobiales bacterium]